MNKRVIIEKKILFLQTIILTKDWMNTNIKYLGLELKSPIIAGSCGLTNSIDNLLELERSGAGAIILKSIFEEQIVFDIKRNMTEVAPIDQYGISYDYVASHVAEDSMEKYFALIREAKQKLTIPLIGSINCYQFQNWITYAKRFEEAGCDALELNMSMLPYETSTSADDVARLYQQIISTLKNTLSIPIAVKVSPYFTDLSKFMEQLSWMGIGGITIFNKTVNVDIDVNTIEMKSAPIISKPDDVYNTLKWTAILCKKVRCDISSSTGVFTSDDVVKMLLAGAKSVQVVSCLYENGLEYMRTLNDGLLQWMSAHNFSSIDQFRGILAVKSTENASLFFRTQSMKHFAEI